MPPAPYLILHQKSFLPHQNAKFACHYINKPSKDNMAILTRCTIQCSKYFVRLLFFEAPKVQLSRAFSFFFFLQHQLIPDNLCSLLRQFKTCSSHFLFLLHPFSLSLFFLSLFFFGGEGWGRLPQLIWDTRGANPK